MNKSVLKMVIADDEVLTLDLMERILDWDNMGIRITGLAKDGYEACSILADEKPDILITDIRMPGMDGLELIKWARCWYDDLKIIIISAHDEFEYAQKAMTYGVAGYVLKPVDDERLEDLVNKVLKEIRDTKEHQIKYCESKSIARDRILKQLLYSRRDTGELKETMDKLGISIKCECFNMLNIIIDNHTYDEPYNEHMRFEEMHETHSSEIVRLIEECEDETTGEILVFENRPGEWIAMLNHDACRYTEDRAIIAKKLGCSIINRLQLEIGIKCFIGISKPHSGLEEMSKAYADTLDLIKYRFYFGDCDMLTGSDVYGSSDIEEIKILEQHNLYIKHLRNGNEMEAIKVIENIFNNIYANAKMEPDRIYNNCLELLIMARKELSGGDYTNVEAARYLNEIGIKTLSSFKTLQGLKTYLLNITSQVSKSLCKSQGREVNRLIQKAREYIAENYNQNITLEDICKAISVSRNYFCYLFKREMGEGIWDYLTRYRIEKSKELLRSSDLKNFEISYRIGYENPSYFSKMFKKYAGMTPQEYRSKLTD
jgi:two-component system response regulator YesN